MCIRFPLLTQALLSVSSKHVIPHIKASSSQSILIPKALTFRMTHWGMNVHTWCVNNTLSSEKKLRLSKQHIHRYTWNPCCLANSIQHFVFGYVWLWCVWTNYRAIKFESEPRKFFCHIELLEAVSVTLAVIWVAYNTQTNNGLG